MQLSTALALAHFARPLLRHGVRGVRAVRSVAQGETLIRVPAAAMLVNSSQVLHLHGVRSAVLLEPAVSQRWRLSCDACGLMAFVMLDEQRAGHTSRWQPYLAMLELDPSLKNSHPVLFSSSRLQDQPPGLRLHVIESRRRMRACYEAVFGTDDARVVQIIGGLSDPAPQFGYARYVEAVLQCSAHHFGVAAGASGDERFLALIPGADLFAAPADGQKPLAHLKRVPGSLSPLVDDYIVEALANIRVDTEITANWFPRVCAEEQLCAYGYLYDPSAPPCTFD